MKHVPIILHNLNKWPILLVMSVMVEKKVVQVAITLRYLSQTTMHTTLVLSWYGARVVTDMVFFFFFNFWRRVWTCISLGTLSCFVQQRLYALSSLVGVITTLIFNMASQQNSSLFVFVVRLSKADLGE